MFEGLWGYEHPLSGQIRRLEEELDALFGTGTSSLTGTRNIRSLPGSSFPAVNVAATPEAIMVYLFAPGLDPKGFDISMQQNLLSIAGTREIPLDEKATYYRRERFSGEFRRAITLPEDADPERVEAKYTNGMLVVTIGRRQAAKPKQIEVR
ncbi:MAG: Hsp20/alpha crystallin family protein [Sinobacteraceae bacterium]|nr:Hsp20/alpha crystallin family protein [Nevskiaceae bacterium]MBV9318184.1 Hsp20/alpha crystallin family protein [Gammaproteobacteria bacterium]